MARYLLRRLLTLLLVLWGSTLLTFFLFRLLPGDPVVLMLGPHATPARVAVLREEMGLNEPWPVQYASYLSHLLRGELGRSYRGQTEVRAELQRLFPATARLALLGFGMSLFGGVSLGALAATTRNRWLEGMVMLATLTLLAIPIYWLALLLLLLFGVFLKWVPISQASGISGLLLPALCIALTPGAFLARLTRASMGSVLQMEHVRAARARGLPPGMLYWHHVLRNAALPILTSAGLIAAELLTGTIFVETIFARPGLGRFAVDAVRHRDLPQVEGVVLLSTALFLLLNLGVDLLYGYLDPRLRSS